MSATSISPIIPGNRRSGSASVGELVGKLTRDRRTGQPVRRNSFDIEDRRAQVFRPIGDGTKHGAIRWRDKYIQLVEEYDWSTKERGARHQIGANAIRVLKTLLHMPGLDFDKGQIDPAIDTIMRLTRFARATVVAALHRLRHHGFLDWVRRTMKTGNEPGEGPQVKQISNAYFFPVERMSERARHRLKQLLGGKTLVAAIQDKKKRDAERREALQAMSFEEGHTVALNPDADQDLGDALASLARLLDQSASSETGLNPSLRSKNKD